MTARRPSPVRLGVRVLKVCCLLPVALCLLLTFAGFGVFAASLFIADPTAALDPARATSLEIVDRRGEPLRTLPLSGGGRARWVTLDRMPTALVDAVIASEDRRFFSHPGVDALAIGRALIANARAGHVVSGASTLTMQLTRLLAPRPRTLRAKLVEAATALRIERALSKREILEQYLNRAYFGRGAHGVEAAALRFFGRPAAGLSDAEATLLAVLPRAPRAYDPITQIDAALRRRAQILERLVRSARLSPLELQRIVSTPLTFSTHDRGDGARVSGRAPHFVDWVLSHLPPDRRAVGGVLRTTLDLRLQRRIERAVRDHLADRTGRLAQAGVVVVDASTGDVLALVGSAAHAGADAGQVNIVTTPRHPGSALKPFIYALALERGESPASIALDQPGATPGYRPARPPRAHGPSRYREALAGSFNLAAVNVLDHVGVPAVIARLRDAGLATVRGTAEDHGLSLALGSPRVRLVDLAAAYGFLVNAGHVTAPRVLLAGEPRTEPRRVFSSEASWLTMDMLADPAARRRAFGAELPLDLPFRVAAKTGTSSGFADTVAVGATSEVIAAAWAGAFDGSGTRGLLAMWGAAPLVRAALLAASDLRGAPLTLPAPPGSIVSHVVCARTGLLATPACPVKNERFAEGHTPQGRCPRHPG